MAYWPRALVLSIFIASLAFGQQPASLPSTITATKTPKSAFDKPTLESYLRHLNIWGPEVKIQIDEPTPSPLLPDFFDVRIKATLRERSAEITYLVSKDGRKILQANVFDIGWNPFRDELSKLKTEGQPDMGTPGATVVIVLFSDFQCSYCKQQAQVIRENLLKNYPKQVRLYFKDYPLALIHPWAKPAAIAARCVFKQNPKAFWDVHDFFFDKQADITPDNVKSKVMELATAKGWDAIQLGSCLDAKTTLAEVDKNFQEGTLLGVNATPTMFINGRRVPNSIDWPTMKLMIDNELEYQKTAKNAGEDCGCDLSLPAAPGAPQLPTVLSTPAKK